MTNMTPTKTGPLRGQKLQCPWQEPRRRQGRETTITGARDICVSSALVIRHRIWPRPTPPPPSLPLPQHKQASRPMKRAQHTTTAPGHGDTRTTTGLNEQQTGMMNNGPNDISLFGPIVSFFFSFFSFIPMFYTTPAGAWDACWDPTMMRPPPPPPPIWDNDGMRLEPQVCTSLFFSFTVLTLVATKKETNNTVLLVIVIYVHDMAQCITFGGYSTRRGSSPSSRMKVEFYCQWMFPGTRR